MVAGIPRAASTECLGSVSLWEGSGASTRVGSL